MRNKTKNKKYFFQTLRNKAFSLIEIIIYLAIFTTVSILVINSFITVVASSSVIRTNQNLLEAGMSSMERISREIRQAENIDLAGSNLGQGTLQLNSFDVLNNPTVIKFSKEDTSLSFYQSGVLSGNLIEQNISLDNLVFRKISTAQGEAVKIEMTLRDTRSKTNRSENFYNTIVLRGEY